MEIKEVKKKRLFTDNVRGHGTVVLNSHNRLKLKNGHKPELEHDPECEFKLIAKAYHESAQELVKGLQENRYFGLDGIPSEDFKVYPVVFLYRHTLELYMKSIILIGDSILKSKGEQPIDRKRLRTEHSLGWLREQLERVFKAYDLTWNLGTKNFKSLHDFRKIIGEFQDIDSRSDSFRYPVNRHGNALLESYFSFNLFDFCGILDELCSCLEGVAIMAHEALFDSY